MSARSRPTVPGGAPEELGDARERGDRARPAEGVEDRIPGAQRQVEHRLGDAHRQRHDVVVRLVHRVEPGGLVGRGRRLQQQPVAARRHHQQQPQLRFLVGDQAADALAEAGLRGHGALLRPRDAPDGDAARGRGEVERPHGLFAFFERLREGQLPAGARTGPRRCASATSSPSRARGRAAAPGLSRWGRAPSARAGPT